MAHYFVYTVNMKVKHVEKREERRPIDLGDFIAMKGILPYKLFRFMAKKINFGFLFGMIGKTFSDRELSKHWTEQEIDDYITENGITDGTIDEIEQKYRYEHSRLECKYIAVSDDIREKFFTDYSGLEQRISDLRKFFKDNGYVRSYYGAFRRNPLVLMEGHEEDRKERAGWDNIVVNTTIQNFEAVVVMRNIVRISRWFRENNMQSRVFGTVHDSVDFYVEVSEMDVVLPKIKTTFEEMFKEFTGVPLTIEMKVGDNYKEGREIK